MNHVRKAHPALTSDHGRNTSKNHVRKACPVLTSDRGTNISETHVKKAQHSHPTSSCHKGFALTYDLILSERRCTYIRPHLVRKALHLHPTSSCQKGSALTSVRVLSKRICTYIWPHLVRKALHLRLIMWEHILQSHQNGFALISDHVGTHPPITSAWLCVDHVGIHPIITSKWICTNNVGTHPIVTSEWICTYIWSCGNTSHSHIRMALHLHLIMWEPIPQSHQNGSVLTSNHVGSNPTVTSEWLCTYIWSCGNQSHSHIRMALHLHLII